MGGSPMPAFPTDDVPVTVMQGIPVNYNLPPNVPHTPVLAHEQGIGAFGIVAHAIHNIPNVLPDQDQNDDWEFPDEVIPDWESLSWEIIIE